jgi:hypothetical protein
VLEDDPSTLAGVADPIAEHETREHPIVARWLAE